MKVGQTAINLRSRIEVQQIAKYLDLSTSHYYELAPDWLEVDTYTKYNEIFYPDGYVNGDRINGTRIVKTDHYMDLPFRVNNNLQEVLFTDGLSHATHLGISHKEKKMNLFFSLENNVNEGIIIETNGYERISLRANIDYHITDKISLSASNNFIKINNDLMGGNASIAFNNILRMEPDVNLFRDNKDGQKYNYIPNNWDRIVKNPLYDLWRKEYDQTKKRFLGAYNIKWNLTDWVNLKVSYGLEKGIYDTNSFTPKETYSSSPKELNSQSNVSNYNLSTTASFNQTWGDLDFKGKLSYIFEKENEERTKDELIYTEELDWHVPTEYEDQSYRTNAEDIFAITSFVYKDRYIFDALYRNDGSSRFGENERRHSYYRLSGAYRISKDLKFPGIQELKLRGAYGTAGVRPGWSYQYETFSNSNGVYYAGQKGNNNLKPAKITEKEIGLDISFLNNFYLETNYSDATTEDSFVNVPLLAPTGGYHHQWQNVGTIQSKTFEVLFKTKLVNTDIFTWNLGVTYDNTQNKILALDAPSFSTGPAGLFKMEAGGKYGNMYGFDFVHTLGDMQNQISEDDNIKNYIVNSDGFVVLKDLIGTEDESPYFLLNEDGTNKEVVIGNVNPDFRMGFNTNLSYKNLSFYTLWKWKKGGDIYNRTAQNLVDKMRHPMMDQMYTKPENKKTADYYKRIYANQQPTTFWVEDASYVRLSEISLYYSLTDQSPFFKNNFLKSVKVGLSGKNLYLFTNYSGYDPETSRSGFIYDRNRYPNFRTYALSFEFKF
jgi:hypothetical protein